MKESFIIGKDAENLTVSFQHFFLQIWENCEERPPTNLCQEAFKFHRHRQTFKDDHKSIGCAEQLQLQYW